MAVPSGPAADACAQAVDLSRPGCQEESPVIRSSWGWRRMSPRIGSPPPELKVRRPATKWQNSCWAICRRQRHGVPHSGGGASGIPCGPPGRWPARGPAWPAGWWRSAGRRSPRRRCSSLGHLAGDGMDQLPAMQGRAISRAATWARRRSSRGAGRSADGCGRCPDASRRWCRGGSCGPDTGNRCCSGAPGCRGRSSG